MRTNSMQTSMLCRSRVDCSYVCVCVCANYCKNLNVLLNAIHGWLKCVCGRVIKIIHIQKWVVNIILEL